MTCDDDDDDDDVIIDVGCGNCVLKIYTNKSGLPAYELCGENKLYSGKTIISQGNYMRLKYVITQVFHAMCLYCHAVYHLVQL